MQPVHALPVAVVSDCSCHGNNNTTVVSVSVPDIGEKEECAELMCMWHIHCHSFANVGGCPWGAGFVVPELIHTHLTYVWSL